MYVKQVGGAAHVFLSALVSAAPSRPPCSSTAGLAAALVPAGDRRRQRGSARDRVHQRRQPLRRVRGRSDAAPRSTPQDIFDGAANPAISMTTFGKAYLAFTAAGPAQPRRPRGVLLHRALGARADAARCRPPGDDAAPGPGARRSPPAGDGVGIVVWGEDGHIYSRRVWATSPSTAVEQADPPTLGRHAARSRPTSRRSRPAGTPPTPTSRSTRSSPAARRRSPGC